MTKANNGKNSFFYDLFHSALEYVKKNWAILLVFSITFWIYSMYINLTTGDESETETALLLLSLLQ